MLFNFCLHHRTWFACLTLCHKAWRFAQALHDRHTFAEGKWNAKHMAARRRSRPPLKSLRMGNCIKLIKIHWIHSCEPNHQFINGWNHLREQVSQRSACIWSLSRMRQAKSSCHWPCTYCMNVHCRRLRSHPRLRQHGNVPNVFSHLLQPHCSKIHADMPVLEAALDLTSELLESSHQTILRGESTLSKLGLQTLQSTARLWTLDSRLISLISQTSEVSGVYKEKCQPLISCTKAAMAMALTLGHSQHQGSCCHVPSLDSSWYENMNKTWTKHAMPQCHAMPCHMHYMPICSLHSKIHRIPPGVGWRRPVPPAGRCGRAPCFSLFLGWRWHRRVWRCLEMSGVWRWSCDGSRNIRAQVLEVGRAIKSPIPVCLINPLNLSCGKTIPTYSQHYHG